MRGRSTIPLSLALASFAVGGHAFAEPPSPQPATPIVAAGPAAEPVAEPVAEIDVDGSEPEHARQMSPLAWTLMGAGTVALGASAFLAVTALSDGESCERNPACAMTEANAITDRLTAADVLAGAGIVSLAGSAVVYYTSGRERAKPAISVKPRQGGAVVLVGGRF